MKWKGSSELPSGQVDTRHRIHNGKAGQTRIPLSLPSWNSNRKKQLDKTIHMDRLAGHLPRRVGHGTFFSQRRTGHDTPSGRR